MMDDVQATKADRPIPTRPGGGVRASVWVLHLALPVLALWLLVAQPQLDVTWQHPVSHFWLVLGVAVVNMALAILVLRSARARSDGRLVLVGDAFLVAAGFLLLHALATPGVVMGSPNTGFEIATPVGLAIASVFFAAAALDPRSSTAGRIVRAEPALRWGLVGVMCVWALMSVLEIPPLSEPLAEAADSWLRWLAVGGVALYVVAMTGFFRTHRRRPSVLLVALITAAALLAEAMVAMVFAVNWALSWWLWHILMAAAFGFVAYSAFVEYRRDGSAVGLFDGVAGRSTVDDLRREYGGALDVLTTTLERSSTTGVTDDELAALASGLRDRFGLSSGQTEVLARAARSLAAERDQARRLGGLAMIGTEARIEMSEDDLLASVTDTVGERFAPDVMRIGVAGDSGIEFPDRFSTGPWPDRADRWTEDVVSGGTRVAVLEFARSDGEFRDRDRAIFATLAAEVAIAVANVRLYRQVDALLGVYLSPDVADSLRSDPSRAGLGGSVVEVSALFADLRGFTSFTERTDPAFVTDVLNRYFGVAVPAILEHGGTVVQFVGDALLAVFDAPEPRPGHARRAASAALAMQEAIAGIAADRADWPRFRIGVNTGYALLGNIGSREFRSFTVIGDAINVAARLETVAEPGTVLIGATTRAAIGEDASVTSLGEIVVKGREQPVVAYRLERLGGDGAPPGPMAGGGD